jgi:hypothetical protein
VLAKTFGIRHGLIPFAKNSIGLGITDRLLQGGLIAGTAADKKQQGSNSRQTPKYSTFYGEVK